VETRAVVYAEWDSREVRIARRVGRAHGVVVDRATRTPDHYSANFPSMARLAGSSHMFTDIHGFGLDIDLSERWQLAPEYRFHHVSNANTGAVNPGINTHTLVLGLTLKLANRRPSDS
jgi:opacity protein-like surface antigen